jgi:hypothetical protein
MRVLLAATLSLAIFACAGPTLDGPGRRQLALQGASFRYLSWGATVHYWTVDAAGAVVWEAPESPTPSPNPPATMRIGIKRFQLDAAQRAALAAAVMRAQKARALPETCRKYIPDGPYGRMSWTFAGAEEGMTVNASCLEGPQADKAGAAFGADRVVRVLAESQPVVDRRAE